MTPRVVAIDFDGTLLRSDGTLSDRTVTAVRALVATDVRVLVVTGRPPRWLSPVARLFDGRGLAVAANGAVTVDLSSGEVVASRHHRIADGLEILARLRTALPGVAFGVERVDGFAHEAGYPRGTRASERADTTAVADDDGHLLAEPPVKILARVPDGSVDAAAARAEAVLDGAAGVFWSGTTLLELAPPGVSKATTLAQVVDDWGVTAGAVAAFGDMPNDIPMLRWAGHGVAVANAHPTVRGVADEITASNDDDGVAQVLERWL